MMQDRYDNPVSTNAAAARDHYIDAVDRLLAGQPGFTATFSKAIEADPDFALGYVGLARAHQYEGNLPLARSTMEQARQCPRAPDTREASHINALGLLIDGKTAEAYAAIRAHVDTYPRDVLVAQTCSSVFGLIGFSGQPGREAEILAYTASLLPHYGDDWWCQSQYAFALCENGALDPASRIIDRSLALNPLNANGAHVRSHVYYEAGETALGISYLSEWLKPYDRSGYLHGHLSWHTALWALEQGDVDTMWQRIDADLDPTVSDGMPLMVMTDMASILYRAELAGVTVPKERWTTVSDYALRFFPNAALGFSDIHAALAHAMAGNTEAVAHFVDAPNAVTGDLVTPIARAYTAIAANKWAEAVDLLVAGMADHARLGGSRAQRDLLEFSLLGALLKLGRDTEVKHLLALRRPVLAGTHSLHGLNAH